MTGKTILLQILTDSRVSNTIIIVYAISKILTSTLVVMYFGTEMIWRLPVLWTSFFVILGAMGGVSFVRKQVLELIDFTDTDLNKHVLRNLFVHGQHGLHGYEIFINRIKSKIERRRYLWVGAVVWVLITSMLVYIIDIVPRGHLEIGIGVIPTTYNPPLVIGIGLASASGIAAGGTYLVLFLIGTINFLRGLNSIGEEDGENIFKYLTIGEITNLLTIKMSEGHEKVFEAFASSSIKRFKRNSNPIASFALKTSMAALLVLLGGNFFWYLRFYTTFSRVANFWFFTSVANFLLLIGVFVIFIYPQQSVHRIMEEGKKQLVTKLEGLSQYKLAIYLKIQSGEVEGNVGDLISEITFLSELSEKIETLLTWPFNYRQLLTLMGTALFGLLSYTVQIFLPTLIQ